MATNISACKVEGKRINRSPEIGEYFKSFRGAGRVKEPSARGETVSVYHCRQQGEDNKKCQQELFLLFGLKCVIEFIEEGHKQEEPQIHFYVPGVACVGSKSLYYINN